MQLRNNVSPWCAGIRFSICFLFQPLADFYMWGEVWIETLSSVFSKTLLFLHLALHVEYQGKLQSKSDSFFVGLESKKQKTVWEIRCCLQHRLQKPSNLYFATFPWQHEQSGCCRAERRIEEKCSVRQNEGRAINMCLSRAAYKAGKTFRLKSCNSSWHW